jgi:putative ABC transport system permease protein
VALGNARLFPGFGYSDPTRTEFHGRRALFKRPLHRLEQVACVPQDPNGQRLQLSGEGADAPWYRVTGVAADVKNSGLTGEDEPEYYKFRGNASADWDGKSSIVVKTSLPTDAVQRWIRSQVASLDPTEPVNIETLSERVNKLADQPRFQTVLVAFFAITGLVLAVIGLYGVISFLVVQRTQKIGVRMALGASRMAILRLVLGKSLRLIVWGTSLGLLAALAASWVLSSLLFSIGPHNPVAFELSHCCCSVSHFWRR